MVMGLTNQLSEGRGIRSIAEYLGFIRNIANKLAIIGSPVPTTNLILHVLNGVGPKFKELAAAIRARDTVIGFKELHDKLVEYESFLKREESSSITMTANAARFNQQRHGNQFQRKYSHNRNNQGGQRYATNNNQGINPTKSSPMICQYYENKGHNARECFPLKHQLGLLVPLRANHTTYK